MTEWTLLSDNGINALGTMLLHFIWQGFTIAAVLAGARVFITSPRLRYWVASLALLSMVGLAVFTFVSQRVETGTHSVPSPRPLAAPLELESPVVISGGTATTPSLPALGGTPDLWSHLSTKLQTHSDKIVIAWLVGVFLLTVRLLGGCWTCIRLKRTGTRPLPHPWQARVEALTQQLNIRHKVTVVTSALATVPMVVGAFRPVVLVPISTFLGLAPDQLEAVLIHELAHIRRYDNLVNLLQRMVETVFFFHPAVWWVSGCIRTEREHCCDDTAARASDPQRYAHALVTLEALRSPRLAVAATDGDLLARIKRLLANAPVRTTDKPSPLTITNLLGTFAILALAVFTLETSLFADQTEEKEMNPQADSHSRKVLDAEPSNAFTRAVNALHPMLQAAGESDWSTVRLHGVLGNSFSFEMRKGGGKVWQEANLEWWNKLPALELGIPARRIEGGPEATEAAWDAVRASIDQGVPVAAICPMSPKPGAAHDWGLLVGYDTSDKTYIVRRRHQEFQVKFDEIVYDQLSVVVYDPTKKVDASRINAKALRNAVAFANATRFPPEGGYPVDARGFAALELWRDDIASGAPIPEQGSPKSEGFFADSRYNANELRFIRKYAADYCRELIGLFPSAASDLETAASYYNEASAAAGELGLVFQLAEEAGEFAQSDRVEASDLISKALQAERGAIASIEAALAQIDH
ncbi:MAG: M48 family metalloprotease [Candidatus Latescibacteria bacterium]|nr:M48 family metalloprotease [Candidatus Latescibacterota bacterium]